MITNSRIAEYITIQQLASHFKVKKEDLCQDMGFVFGDESPNRILYSPMLRNERDFNHEIHAAKDLKLNITSLLSYDKFVKTDVYRVFLEGEALANNPARLLLTIYLKGSVWVAFRARDGYYGLGGIYTAKEDNGFVIEPIKNYLNYSYQPPQ